MLNHVKLYLHFIVIIIFGSCSDSINEKITYFDVSKNSYKEYFLVLNQLNDSVKMFVLNKFKNYEAEYTYQYKIDSLICFNNSGNRFIGCRHLYVNIPNAIADDLQIILGEKINNNWYFLKTSSISIPRSMVKDHPENKPLSYSQLHEIALKEVYGGYLNKNGEINEAWFTSHFEGPGWGDFEHQENSDWMLK